MSEVVTDLSNFFFYLITLVYYFPICDDIIKIFIVPSIIIWAVFRVRWLCFRSLLCVFFFIIGLHVWKKVSWCKAKRSWLNIILPHTYKLTLFICLYVSIRETESFITGLSFDNLADMRFSAMYVQIFVVRKLFPLHAMLTNPILVFNKMSQEVFVDNVVL